MAAAARTFCLPASAQIPSRMTRFEPFFLKNKCYASCAVPPAVIGADPAGRAMAAALRSPWCSSPETRQDFFKSARPISGSRSNDQFRRTVQSRTRTTTKSRSRSVGAAHPCPRNANEPATAHRLTSCEAAPDARAIRVPPFSLPLNSRGNDLWRNLSSFFAGERR